MTVMRQLRSPATIVVLETVASGLIMFAGFSALARIIDMKTLGLWFLLSSLLAYARIMDFWTNGLSSFVGEALGRGERETALSFVGTALISGVIGNTLLSVAATGVLWVVAPWLAGAEHAETIRMALPLMAASFWFAGVAGTLPLGFLGFGRPGLKAIQTVGGAAAFFIAALLLAPRFGLTGILVAQAIQGAVMLLFGVIAFAALVAGSLHFLRWDRHQFRALAVFGTKSVVLGAVQLSIDPIIRLLTNHYGGLAAVTVVELASRLVLIVRGVILSLGQVLVPALARLQQADAPAARALLLDMRKLQVLAAIPAFGVLVCAAPLAELVLLSESDTGFIACLALLAVGWGVSTLAAPSHCLLVSQRRLRPLFLVHLVMSGGAIVLGILLGEVVGQWGALAGAMLAVVAASLYLELAVGVEPQQAFHLAPVIGQEPVLMVALVAVAITAVLATTTEAALSGRAAHVAIGCLGVVVVLAASARPSQIRGVLQLAGKVA